MTKKDVDGRVKHGHDDSRLKMSKAKCDCPVARRRRSMAPAFIRRGETAAMKITAIETIALKEFPNLLWVQIHTDAGMIGLGETFYGAQSVAGFIHETAAPYLLGKDPLQIDRHNRHFLNHYLGFKSVGAEMRGASAVDI